MREVEREFERGPNAGVAQLVERKPSKLDVAGSSPVSRSANGTREVMVVMLENADVAQLVEHTLGKGEVTGSIPVVSSGNNKGRGVRVKG
jgi:hypothetical protein